MPFLWFYKKKYRGVKHYERIRDKLTLREEPEEIPEPEEERQGSGAGLIANFIGAAVVLIVGVNLIPMVSDVVNDAQTNVTVGGGAETILGLTTIFFALGIISAGVSLAICGLRKGGFV